MVKDFFLKNKFLFFIFIVLIFSFGLFFGELILDFLLKSKRDNLKIEIRDSVLTAIIVGILILLGNNSLKPK